MVEQTTPEKAAQILHDDPNAVYLDVRTVAEYEGGHPAGSVNIPVAFFEPPRRDPIQNDLFSHICERRFAKDARILVGCASGVRSLRAAEILGTLGFTNVTNVDGGFSGRRDASGRTIERGWVECRLPVERGNPTGRCYEELRKKYLTPMPTLKR